MLALNHAGLARRNTYSGLSSSPPLALHDTLVGAKAAAAGLATPTAPSAAGGTINTLFARILEFLLRYVVAPGPWAAVDRAIARLWASPPALRFTMLRMGQMEVAPSRGELRFEPTTGGNYPRCAVSYDDVADAIVAFVAQDAAKPGPWGRKAVYLNYVRASSP